jgi:sulfonate transport system substrate-binding protein
MDHEPSPRLRNDSLSFVSRHADAPVLKRLGIATSACGLLTFLLLGLACQRDVAGTHQDSAQAPRVFRVVRAKQLTALSVLEKQGGLERALSPLGFGVEWLEFLAGPQQLEAVNAGALDLAATAESPVVFSQAAGADIVYLATTPSNGRSISLLVPNGSNVQRVSDLKGKRVAFQKASIGHYLLVKALATEGLSLKDVQLVYLTPPDANAAFSEAKVDAWLIWEPYVTRALQARSGRVLLDGQNLRDTGNFYTTSRSFASQHADVLNVFFAELRKAERWSNQHPAEMARMLSPSLLIDAPTLERMHAKYDFRLLPITPGVIEKQQEVADLWFKLGLLPARVDVRKGFLPSAWYAELMPAENGGGS